MRAPIGVTILVCAVLGVGMLACSSPHCRGQDASIATAPPSPALDSAFASLGPEQAYELFTCGYRGGHPPNYGIVTPFARKGGAVVPLLTDELRTERDDFAIAGIIHVLRAMQRLESYDVRGDSVLLNAARTAISRMKEPAFRDGAEEWLSSLEARRPLDK